MSPWESYQLGEAASLIARRDLAVTRHLAEPQPLSGLSAQQANTRSEREHHTQNPPIYGVCDSVCARYSFVDAVAFNSLWYLAIPL